MPHPSTTPIEQWPEGWLVLEVASLLDVPQYMWMHAHERQAAGYPVTAEEMRAFIRGRYSEAKAIEERQP